MEIFSKSLLVKQTGYSGEGAWCESVCLCVYKKDSLSMCVCL